MTMGFWQCAPTRKVHIFTNYLLHSSKNVCQLLNTHTHDCKCTGTQLNDSITWSLFKESVKNFKYKEILFLVYIQIHVYASI